MFFDQRLEFFLSAGYSAAFRKKGQELSFGDQFFADVEAPNEFSLAVDLWIGGPSTVVSEPIPHILIFDDIVESKLYLVVLEYFQHGFRESAFGLTGSSFDEDDHR